MNKNDPFAQVFPDTPRFKVPPASHVGSGAVGGGDPFAQVFSDTPRFEMPHSTIFDSDADGVIDPWDCEPFNPGAQGWFGDAWKRVTSSVRQATRVDYGRAAARRASVRRAVARRIAPVTHRVRAAVRRAPIHISRERAATRRADVTRMVSRKAAPITQWVRAAAVKAPIHVSRERAAERRADLTAKLGVDFGRAAERRAAVTSAGVLGAPKQVLRGIAGMGEMFAAKPGTGMRPFAEYTPKARRAAVVSGISAFAAKMSPIGVAAAAPGEPDKGDVLARMIASGAVPDRPTTITTGVGGVPGQPDRAGDVHADTGKPFVPKFTGWEADLTGEALVDETEKPLSIFGWTPFTKEMDIRAESMTARQQAKFPEGTISKPLMWFHEKTASVAEAIRGLEKPMERVMTERPTGIAKYAPGPVLMSMTPEPLRRFVIGLTVKAPAAAVETAGMIPIGIQAMGERPSIILPAAAVGLYGMGGGMLTGFVTDPFGTAGELIGFGKITKAVPRIPTPKGISSTTIAKVARAADVTAAKVARAAPRGIAEAMTRIAEAAPPVRLPTARVSTPKGLAPEKAIKFEAGMKVAQRLKHVEAPIKQPLDFNVVKALRGAGNVVETWVKTHPKQKTIIGGSGAAWAQFKGARKPGDIDMYVANPKRAGTEMYAGLAKKLGADNVRKTENPEWGSVLIETRAGTKGYWSHAVDLHPLADAAGRMEFGFATQTPEVIGGIRYVPAGELMIRKAASVLMPRGEKIAGGGTIGPKPHRMKDIADFPEMTRQLAAKESAAAEGAWLFKQRKVGRAAETEQLRHVYEFHAGLYGEPFVRAYGRLPPGVRRPPQIMLAGYQMLSPPAERFSVVTPPYDPTTPPSSLTTPPYDPTTPPSSLTTPPYDPTTPPYDPTTPPYDPTTPPYDPTTPPYDPTTPPYDPTTPPYDPTTPPYDPTTPPHDPTITTTTTTTTTKKLPRDDKKKKPRRRKPRGKRGPFDWFLKHELMTLEGFLGGAAKPATGAFPEPDLGSPVDAKVGGRPGLLDVPAKKAGGRAKRPGLLDVPPGW